MKEELRRKSQAEMGNVEKSKNTRFPAAVIFANPSAPCLAGSTLI
jgi:hypothetical protein